MYQGGLRRSSAKKQVKEVKVDEEEGSGRLAGTNPAEASAVTTC